MALRALPAAMAALGCICLPLAAEANGRAGPAPQTIEAPNWQVGAPAAAGRFAWRSGSDIVAVAAIYVGQSKFTPFAGPWCADAVSVWLRSVGKPPLANRMAASALAYGPRGSGAPGELAVIATRRGYAGHVGIVVAVHGNSVDIVSGNWGHRVAYATIPRWQVTAFVRT